MPYVFCCRSGRCAHAGQPSPQPGPTSVAARCGRGATAGLRRAPARVCRCVPCGRLGSSAPRQQPRVKQRSAGGVPAGCSPQRCSCRWSVLGGSVRPARPAPAERRPACARPSANSRPRPGPAACCAARGSMGRGGVGGDEPRVAACEREQPGRTGGGQLAGEASSNGACGGRWQRASRRVRRNWPPAGPAGCRAGRIRCRLATAWAGRVLRAQLCGSRRAGLWARGKGTWIRASTGDGAQLQRGAASAGAPLSVRGPRAGAVAATGRPGSNSRRRIRRLWRASGLSRRGRRTAVALPAAARRRGPASLPSPSCICRRGLAIPAFGATSTSYFLATAVEQCGFRVSRRVPGSVCSRTRLAVKWRPRFSGDGNTGPCNSPSLDDSAPAARVLGSWEPGARVGNMSC